MRVNFSFSFFIFLSFIIDQKHQNKKMISTNTFQQHRMKQQLQQLMMLARNTTLKKHQPILVSSWNINGNLNVHAQTYPAFPDSVHCPAHIHLFQEAIGSKFIACQEREATAYGTSLDANKVTNDAYGILSPNFIITAINGISKDSYESEIQRKAVEVKIV